MPSKTYDYEKYSLIDINEYLKSKGYEAISTDKGLRIANSNITIRRPVIDVNGLIHATIYFKTTPEPVNYSAQKKTYEDLKRKFGCNTKHGGSIKDLEKISVRDYKKKKWFGLFG